MHQTREKQRSVSRRLQSGGNPGGPAWRIGVSFETGISPGESRTWRVVQSGDCRFSDPQALNEERNLVPMGQNMHHQSRRKQIHCQATGDERPSGRLFCGRNVLLITNGGCGTEDRRLTGPDSFPVPPWFRNLPHAASPAGRARVRMPHREQRVPMRHW